ncbi:M18 family aminopeptidase [Methylococcus sp. EFPC2]|uniref:M18 family aminopeptidase n=1 Tax=Methylococcus sp. EFPC2 TaxID=2812648 RepID=UPI0019676EBD|nr:M18 family aminopeptidase [Methylococcus sp. EFPC2]QSA98571.1 M18 family aminopeptidase [Methylococcus sp. EFPC2]
MQTTPEAILYAQDLLDFIDASPSPWHAVDTVGQRLLFAGFEQLQETERWSLSPGGRYFVVRGGGSLIAFSLAENTPDQTGFRIVGAHTDSPGLRLKPKCAHLADSVLRLGVEVYGGPILASFTDRDLSLAGCVNLRAGNQLEARLLRFEQPLVRLPNLAIHMNRGVNEEGLKLHKQNELPLLLSHAEAGDDAHQHFAGLLADALAVEPAEIVNWEFNVYDTQPGSFWGANREFIADSQLDNLASCHAAFTALIENPLPRQTAVVGLFDHEEVGSLSTRGAESSFLDDVLGRISQLSGLDWQGYKQALAGSFFISADMAHGYHPNFPQAYEPQHRVQVNGGPVIKTNANQRYATDSASEALFITLCEAMDVPYQQYAHRTDLGCGSTIGPTVAAALGVHAVDVGNPLWAMHSVRESAGVLDHAYLIRVLGGFFGG